MLKKIKRCAALLVVLTTLFSLITVNAAGMSATAANAAYANFRNVTVGKIGQNNLYRSQHPANGSARSLHANRLAEENNIVTVLNLSDSPASLQKYFTQKKIAATYYYRTLYSKGGVYTAHLGTGSHRGSSYRKKVTSAVKFMAKHQGPYLVHCEIGRDRTGFVMLLLESLMGAPYSYMVDDFARSDIDRAGATYAKAKKKAVKRLNDDLHFITGKKRSTNWSKQNLAQYAEKYLRKGGMTAAEIIALKKNLSVSYPKGGAKPETILPAVPSKTTAPAARPADSDSAKAADGKSTENGTADQKTTDSKTTDSKTTDTKAADSKTTDTKAADSKTTDTKAADSKTVQPKPAQPVNKETPAYRNLSMNGKTILTKEIKKGKKATYYYTVQTGKVKKYPVRWTNSNKSVVKVISCGKGRLKIKGRRKGTALLTVYSKSDRTKRILITVKVRK